MSEANFTVQAEQQHVVGRIVDMMSDEARDMGLVAFSKSSGLHTPDTSQFRDKCVVMQVLTKGPGNVSRGTLNPCLVNPGDYVLINLYHRSHELTIQGDTVSAFNWENVMGRLNVNDKEKCIEMEPLQGFIVCQTDEKAAHSIMMGQSRIINPGGDAMYSGDGSTDEKGRPKLQIKVAIEKVVQVGPGAVVDGLWQEPTQSAGDHVLYDTSVSPVRFTIAGQTYTLVHMRHVIMTFRRMVPAELTDKQV